MSVSHPLAPAILPFCQLYPHQAPSLFQSFLDINLAQAWKDVKVIDLPECQCVALAGSPKAGSPQSFVLPMSLTTPTSLAEFSSIFTALSTRYPSSFPPSSPSSPSSTPPPLAESSSPSPATLSAPSTESEEAQTPTIYLSIVEKDSSVVYYVLRRGVVSPKEVPE
ncbi:tRNA intron endonuclease [Leucosporidium creatinivorum]|uniref:tRNA intron endonuclease n=1 Tax=Leucosporidium creatinivorum TaxID=106004 RepID=A0A1Y2FT23_9BASI|nr:tRNA intron endonuclease [Leucosporidium creatinivorum]